MAHRIHAESSTVMIHPIWQNDQDATQHTSGNFDDDDDDNDGVVDAEDDTPYGDQRVKTDG